MNNSLLFMAPTGEASATVSGGSFGVEGSAVLTVLLAIAAVLVVVSMRGRGAPDWHLPLGLYLCLAVFLRGYFFNYYHGGSFGRVTVLVVLLVGLLVSAALWEDRALPHEVPRVDGVREVPEAQGFHVAALLHVAAAIALFVHSVLPRRWLVRATDELADRSGLDAAADAPVETIDDPVERARRSGRPPGSG